MVTGASVAPLIRCRQRLVDEREEVSAHVSGRVADSIANMETIHASRPRTGKPPTPSRVADLRRKSVRCVGLPQPAHRRAVVSPLSVLANALGLLLAVALSGGSHGIEVIIVAFTYYSNATRIMFEFNQTYRHLESSLTEAAQFTDLLLTPPTVTDRPPRSRCSRRPATSASSG